MPDEDRQVLLDALISALLRDEDWRPLLEGHSRPDLERLMEVAEAVHWTAGQTPKAGPRERFRFWARMRAAFEGRGTGDAAARRGSFMVRGFTSSRARSRNWRSDAFGWAPGGTPNGADPL